MRRPAHQLPRRIAQGAVSGAMLLFGCSLLLCGPLQAAEPNAAATAIAVVEEDPRRPPAITVEEVPRVPEEIFAELSRYQNVRAAGFAGWAPSGRGMLIRTRFGNTLQLHRVYEPGGRREQITFLDEPVSGWFIPESKRDELMLSMSRGGDENDQIYYRHPKSGDDVLLTDGKSRNGAGAMNADGSRIIVSSNQRNGRDTDLYLVDSRKADSMELIFPTDREYWYAADWSRDGKQLLLGRYVSINESYFGLFDLATKTKTDLKLPGKGTAAIGSLDFSPDGKYVYLTTDARGEYLELARLELATGKYRWLTEDLEWDISSVEIDRKSGQIAFTTNADGASKLYLLDGQRRRELAIPLAIVSSLEFSPDGQQLGLSLSRPDRPTDAYALDLKTGELTQWTFSELGGLDASGFVVPEIVRYRSFDKREIPAFVYRPRGATAKQPAAVVIQIHGGPESQFRPYFSSATQFYVSELGAAVICPNVRGSRGYGKTYLKLDNGPLREDSVKDIGALLDWIATQPDLDAKRVAVTGGSYGGYMVLASLVHYSDRLQAGVDHVGVANFITFLENTSAYRRDLRRAEYGDERDPEMRKIFERINPTGQADKIRAALMVTHGVNDPRVPFSEAKQVADKVRAQGRPVWTVYADNEGHGFSKRVNRDYSKGVEALFLMRHLDLKPAGDE